MTTGNAGSMGPPQGGEVFNATNPQVDAGIAAAITKKLEGEGFTNVHTTCTGINPTTAKCNVSGTNQQGVPSSTIATVAVNQQNGDLTVTNTT
jgi:hypothetical protein